MGKLKTLLKIICGLAVLFAGFIAWHMHSDVPVTTSEVYRDDEPAQARRAAENFVKVIEATATTHAARGAHAKGHACVRAYFEVADTISKELRHGVFSTPGRVFKSWIRFSNGSSNLATSQDPKNDSRGMAIKVLGAGEQPVGVSTGKAVIQDFLMHNNPVFFSSNIENYNQLVESEHKLLSFFAGWNPFRWRLRELTHVLETLSPPPYSPLWEEYFSNTAYKLGPHNIKFSARACSTAPASDTQDRRDADFLRKTMAKELARAEGCLRFMVQVQVPGRYMPIEDPSIEWRESDSPFIPVASIRIPVQAFDSEAQQQFCENLSFSPWHTLVAHRPVGELNRIRKLVYEASSSFRHTRNRTEVPTSLDW